MDDNWTEWMHAKIEAQLVELAEVRLRLAEQVVRAKEIRRRHREARGETNGNGKGSGWK